MYQEKHRDKGVKPPSKPAKILDCTEYDINLYKEGKHQQITHVERFRQEKPVIEQEKLVIVKTGNRCIIL